MPSSMTGFARKEAAYPWGELTCEIRSVNHRYLEPSFRLTDTLRMFEPKMRDQLKGKISRGKVEINLQLKTETAADQNIEINTELASTLAKIANDLKMELKSNNELNPLELLRWPGIIKSSKIDEDTLTKAVLGLFSDTLSQLIDNRRREGEELQKFIQQRIDDIQHHVVVLREKLPEILRLHQGKLRAKLESLEVELDEERFNQEAVYIAQKADVAEELDRLEAHVAEASLALKDKKPIGRRLDFLMQEFNREANTLSSKSLTSDTTQIAVELKVLIEQMREQIQNIE